MAQSFWVLIARESLPSPIKIKNALVKARLPVTVIGRWSWGDVGGWLPMRWRKTETGCEVELEKLTKKETAALKKAGHGSLDTKIVITIRGWESLKVGVAFGATIAVLADGCVTESDDEYIDASCSLEWAKDAIDDADTHLRLEMREAKAKKQALGDVKIGDADQRFDAALAQMTGVAAKQIRFVMSTLGVQFENNARVVGSAWRIQDRNGECHDQSRYTTTRNQQVSMMGGDQNAALQKKLEAMDALLDKAAIEDEQGAISAQAALKTWPDNPKLKSISFQRPNMLRLQFEEGMSIEFVGGLLGQVDCSVPPLRFVIGRDGVQLR